MKTIANTLPFNRRTVLSILRGRLDPREAYRRTRLVLEDVPRLRFPLRLRFMECGEGRVWPYYVYAEARSEALPWRSVNVSPTMPVGYGLNWGDLTTLSQVVTLARHLWGWHWVWCFRQRMSSMGNHLSFIEELWWLGRFESPRAIEQECCPFPGCIRTVDWQFETQGVVINLEVKYRPYDWLRWVDERRYASELSGYFDTVAEKFPRKIPGQVNLLAMTLLGALGPELRAKTTSFLEAHPVLDGVLFWSIARRDVAGCECIFRPETRFVQSLLCPAEAEDWTAGAIRLSCLRPRIGESCPLKTMLTAPF